MRIAIMGQGYVGITATVGFAEAGHEVIGIECDAERLALLRLGQPPVFEPALTDALTDLLGTGRVTFGDSLATTHGPVDAVVVAVGSPPLPSGGADLREATSAIEEIAALDPLPRLVVMKSTVPPGTSERLIGEAHPSLRLRERYVVSPEFLSLGSALADWRSPSRIVAGLHDATLLPLLRDLYRGIEAPWVVTEPTTAEMIKYASNAFLATKISFINEIANLCEKVGGNVDHVVTGMGSDPRIGLAYMRPGLGYGGSCFPKDTRALAHLSSLEGHSMPLLEAVITVNNAQRLLVVRQVRDGLQRPGGSVAVLGLSFKPGTDDLREAPSVTVVSELLSLGYRVRVWDPVVTAAAVQRVLPGAERADRLADAVAGAHAAVVVTEWSEVVNARWEDLVPRMREPRLIIDGRNCLDPFELKNCGAVYRGIGRPDMGAPSAVPHVAHRRVIVPQPLEATGR